MYIKLVGKGHTAYIPLWPEDVRAQTETRICVGGQTAQALQEMLEQTQAPTPLRVDAEGVWVPRTTLAGMPPPFL